MKDFLEMDADSIAYPVIGAGSGGFDQDAAIKIMLDAFASIDCDRDVRIVRYVR